MGEGETLWALDYGPECGKALFDRHCPKCGRYLLVATIDAKVNGLGDMVEAKADCKKCGTVDPWFVGWF